MVAAVSFLTLALTLFLIIDSVGNINGYLGLVEEITPRGRRRILIREMLVALVIMFIFHYFGEVLLTALELQPSTVQVAAGIILFLIAIKMVFPKGQRADHVLEKAVPFIVPIATPMIAGPSVLATIMIYAHDESSGFKLLLAILAAWGASVIVLSSAAFLKRSLGDKALLAIERLMGLVLTLMAVEMFLKGIRLYAASV